MIITLKTATIWLFLLLVLFYLRSRSVHRATFSLNSRQPTRPTLTLQQAQQQLQTGDLVLFAYRSQRPIVRAFLHLYQTILGTEWSHVGLIVKIGGIPYIAENTARERKRGKYGYTNLNPFMTRALEYRGLIAVRRLNKPLPAANQERLLKALEQLIGIPFEDHVEKHIIHRCFLAKCPPCQRLFKAITNLPDQRAGLFCTELVSHLLEASGLLDLKRHKIPHHCSLPIYYTDFNRSMKLIPGYQYSKEIDLLKK